jgi:heme exporter protein B
LKRLLNEINFLVKKEILLELRQKYVLGSILLYIVSVVFVCYLTFKQIYDVQLWNSLFWIIVLFSSFNSLSKTFSQEQGIGAIYVYSLASPQAVILSKIFYNFLLTIILNFVAFIIYIIFIGGLALENANFLMLILSIFLGSLGLASILTMVAGIASKTQNSIGIMSILGFPIILPFLLTALKFSKNALDGIAWTINYEYAIVLLLINLMVISLSYILFPYLWRE